MVELFRQGCKLIWSEPIEARVWPFSIVVVSPIFGHLTGVAVAGEQVFVQAFVT